MTNSYHPNQLLFLLGLLITCLSFSCEDDDDTSATDDLSINTLTFVDEFVIPADEISGQTTGGLSSIDFHNGLYYMICDDANAPVRFYTATFTLTNDEIQDFSIQDQVEFTQTDGSSFPSGTVDPEALRYEPNGDYLVWTSEGFVNDGVDPSFRTATSSGVSRDEFSLPSRYQVDTTSGRGPRHNGVIEGLSLRLDGNGYWLGMELPLEQDGPAPTTTDTDSPVRILSVDRDGNAIREFAYELDPVVRPGGFSVNGLVELLE